MKKAILILLILSAVIPRAASAETYSLEDLCKIALEKNETVRSSEEDIYISEKEKDRAMAALIPTFSAFGSHTEYSNGNQSASSSIQTDSSTSWGLSLDKSLSTSGRELKALKIAKDGIVKAGHDHHTVREKYLLTVASAFYDVLKAQEALEIAGANVERLTKHRDAANIRLKVGETTKTVLLRAEAELAGAQSDLIKSENGLKLAKTTLARTAGITGDYDLKKDEAAGHPAISTADFDSLKQIAFSERYELKSAELEEKIAEDQIVFTKGLYWPDVSIQGVYSRREDRPDPGFGNKESISGTVKINFPFYEGGLRVAEVRQAEARRRQAEYRLADLKNSINVEVEDAYLNLITLSGVLDKLKAEADYARDNYYSVTKQFQFGLANSLDVMDANNLLVTSERELSNARYDYQLAILKLERATGTLLKTVSGK